jgi:hypothetical protein
MIIIPLFSPAFETGDYYGAGMGIKIPFPIKDSKKFF